MDEQLQRIFEVVSDGILVVNPLTETIVATNSAAFRLLGYAKGDLIGRSLTSCTGPDFQRLLAAYLYAPEPGGNFDMQALLRRKDGTALPGEVRGVVIAYAERPHYLLTIRDLSAEVRAEEQVWEKEAQYRGIFEATGEGMLIIDLRDGIIQANPAACRLLGYSHDELIGLPPSALVEPAARPSLADWLRTIGEGGTAQVQVVGRGKDGRVFDAEIHGSGVSYESRRRILAVMRDITERVQAHDLLERRVAERTRELSTLLDVSHDVASTLHLQPLLAIILEQLKVVAPYSGAAILQVQGEELVVLVRQAPGPDPAAGPAHYPLAAARPFWDVLQQGKPLTIDDVRGEAPLARAYRAVVGRHQRTSFAHERSLLAVPMVLRDRVIGLLTLAANEPSYFTAHHAALALAVAQQAAVAIENARLYEQVQRVAVLEERQRLARELHDSVSQALYGIALGARTARTLLDRDAAQAAQPLDYVLSLAETGLAEMRALIFELLPTALQTEGLVAALQRQAAVVQARHGITVDLALGEEPAAPLVVKEALYRIAQEALNNVVKHAQARTARLRLGDDSTALSLEVRDDGVGFDPAASFPGHLGQSTMRERAARLNGTLTVTSAPGQGTRVEIHIPI